MKQFHCVGAFLTNIWRTTAKVPRLRTEPDQLRWYRHTNQDGVSNPAKDQTDAARDYPLERRLVDDLNAIARFVLICSSVVLVWLQIRRYRRREK